MNRDISTMRSMIKFLMLLCLLVVGHSAFAQTTGTVTYVYTDPQGTPLAEADAHGNITATFDYTPYGSTALGTSPNGPGYTGHVNDPETNLVYMQARYYDPATGRFLSSDPDTPTPGNTFNFGRYTYTDDNPIMGTDPTGKQCAQCLYSPGESLERQVSINAGASKKALVITAAVAPLLPASGFVGATAAAVTVDTIATGSVASGILLNGPSVVASGGILAEMAAAANGMPAPNSAVAAAEDSEISLTSGQSSNLTRFNKSLPSGNTGTSVDSLGEGVVFTSTVPGNVPGSSAVYQKTVDSGGQTSGFLKTTFAPDGSVAHVKDKISNTIIPHDQ
jgi:RHS repeat-associated protein